MRLRSRMTAAFAVAAGLFAAGCGDSGLTTPEAHTAPAVTAPNHYLLGSPLQVNVLQRNVPLAQPETASVRVGVLGGSMALRDAGLLVIIPALAVTRATTLTVVAQAGSAVAYQFGPHGTHFLVPLVVTQDLSKTNLQNINPFALFAGYYDSLDPDGNTATITELLNVNVNLLSLSAVFTVQHFSGYLVASGRSGSLQ